MLILLCMHVTNVLFLVLAGNSALTMGFYWSYTLLLYIARSYALLPELTLPLPLLLPSHSLCPSSAISLILPTLPLPPSPLPSYPLPSSFLSTPFPYFPARVTASIPVLPQATLPAERQFCWKCGRVGSHSRLSSPVQCSQNSFLI